MTSHALRATLLRVEATRSVQRRYAPEDRNHAAPGQPTSLDRRTSPTPRHPPVGDATKSTSLPMALGEIPPTALPPPMGGSPALVRRRVPPVPAAPLVAPAVPIPIATQPDISGRGRRTVFLDTRWRRSNCDY